MKAMDVFSGLSWGDLSRYRIRHNQTIHKEKAAALDDRIRQVLASDRSYSWALMTLEFCSKESQALSRDTAQYSKEAARLPELKQAAEKLIRQHKEQEAEARRKEANKADDSILSLSTAVRSSYWCGDVENADKAVQALPQEIRSLMRQLNLLQKLTEEAAEFRRGDEIEAGIRQFLQTLNKDTVWLESARRILQAGPNDPDIRLIRDKELLKKLDAEYWRVTRLPEITKYTDMLAQVEKGLWKQQAVLSQFQIMDGELARLGYDLTQYIDRFQPRWAAAKVLIIKELNRLEEVRKAKELAELHQRNKTDLQRYLDCLKDVEKGKASSQDVRNTFGNLGMTVNNLGYDPEEYCAGFRARWRKAEETVAQEQRIAEEKQRQAEEAARIQQEKDALKPYIACLEKVEKGEANQASVRNTFGRLNRALNKLGFDPETHYPGFWTRWHSAEEAVAQANRIAEEQRRQAEEAARIQRNREMLQPYLAWLEKYRSGTMSEEALLAEFRALDASVDRLGFDPEALCHGFRSDWHAKQIRMKSIQEDLVKATAKSAIKQQKKENAKYFFLFALSMLVSLGLSFGGVMLLSSLGAWWAQPLIMALGAFLYLLLYRVREDDMYAFPNILLQILFYPFSFLFLLFFEQGLFSIIGSMVLVALVFNVYPRLRRD